ncbi:MAG: hypothetical protein M5U08_26210 [Burkholderiales bacterium]|nr:hypothetical protein [Burkholderiales bacterium]
MIEVATRVAVPPPMPMMPCTRPALTSSSTIAAAPLIWFCGRRVAVGTVLLAHHLDREPAARGHLLGADVAGEGRRLLHAEVEQDGLVPAPRDEVLDEDDVLAAGVQVADHDDALLVCHRARLRR